MKAAIVTGPGEPPRYTDFEAPTPGAGEERVAVTASALSPLTKSRAAGTHYSSEGAYPFVAGVDGIGTTEGGRRVYFVLPRSPFGALAQQSVAKASQCIDVPEGLDDVTAAALANPGMSSWAALTQRAKFVEGETVLVNGATGSAGSLAVQVAKYLGAKKVIATGRNLAALESVRALGADVTLALTPNPETLEESLLEPFAEGIDVVLDYLWGESARTILIAGAKAGKDAVPIRFVQVGSASAATLTLPSAALRSSAIELMGSGIGSIPLGQLLQSIAGVFQAALPGGFKIATRNVPLGQVERTWNAPTDGARVVFTV